MPVLDRVVDFGEGAGVVVFDGDAFGAGFADGHGVAGVFVVQCLFAAAVVGDFATRAGITVEMARRIDPTIIDPIFFYDLGIDFDAQAGAREEMQ